ncbi:tyrosine-protein phosphatase [Culicoidibacter larvae]|nr:tyrosine-protein phosphatase [Culicoidibacter larvae]
MHKDIGIRRFNFENVYNLRELGGYATKDNAFTNYNVYLRSDCLSELSVNEQECLLSYGVTSVIDLRYNDEILIAEDPFINTIGVAYYNIPLSNNLETITETSLGDAYVQMAKDKKFIRHFFKAAATSTGTLLFHCSAGKDRTGVVAALLLLLAGVDKEDIIADYQVSYSYLQPKFTKMPIVDNEKYGVFLNSNPENIIQLIDWIEKKYKTIETFLTESGVSISEIAYIKNKFINSL